MCRLHRENRETSRVARALAAAVALMFGGMAAPANAVPQYKLKLLHAFCKFAKCADGNYPNGALILDQTGDVFGATYIGGKYQAGVVFKLAPNGTKYAESILHNFCKNTCKDYFPAGDLVADQNGVFYGVAGNCGGFEGGGTIFSLTHGANGWGVRLLHTFVAGNYICSGLAYKGQESGALWNGTSPLFGVTDSGGKYGNGYVYELKPSGWTFANIHNFQSGGNPNRPLVDAQGNVFGTAGSGGKYYGGLMYKLAAGTWKESTLRNFCSEGGSCPNGRGPEGQLLMDAAGDLFTVTVAGGTGTCNDTDGCGVVVERTVGGSFKVLYTFCSLANCADGADPQAGLTMDSSGRLFGTAARGGSALHCAVPIDGGCGVAFELTQNGGSWSEAVLHSFCNWDNCGDGGSPVAPLAIDGAGDLFGNTPYFGAHGNYQKGGVTFELIPQ